MIDLWPRNWRITCFRILKQINKSDQMTKLLSRNANTYLAFEQRGNLMAEHALGLVGVARPWKKVWI